MVPRNGQLKLGKLSLQKEAQNFVYFRAIQGRSGGTLVDPTLQDNVLLLDDFADCHPGRIDSRKKSQEREAVSVFHSREPDVRQSRSGRSSTRCGQTQNRGAQKILGESTKIQ